MHKPRKPCKTITKLLLMKIPIFVGNSTEIPLTFQFVGNSNFVGKFAEVSCILQMFANCDDLRGLRGLCGLCILRRPS
jgi:hypothetical protein